MNLPKNWFWKSTPLLAFAMLWLAGCASGPASVAPSGDPAQREPAALAILSETSAKLGNARTIQVEAEKKLDPALGLGLRIESGRVKLAVKRPNQFHALQPAGAETVEIAYDGSMLCIMHPGPKHHALEPITASSIEQFAQIMEERFGFRPPVADLLASDMSAELLIDVTSARVLGSERVGGTRCHHVRLEQEGMITDLWVGAEDRLPHRMLMTVTDMDGHPTSDIRLSNWKLDQPLDESLFSKRPAADSLRVPMVKSQ